MSDHRVVCSATLYGQTVQNVLHLKNRNNAFTQVQIANDVVSNYISQVRKRQQSDLVWNSVLVQNLSNPVEAPFSLIINLAGQSFSSLSMPSFASYVIKLSTGFAGRHGRGRIFVPGINFNSNEKGFFTPAEITQWETNVFPAFRAAYISNPNNTLALCVRASDGQMHEVTAAQLRTVVGCQRRRMPGIGI